MVGNENYVVGMAVVSRNRYSKHTQLSVREVANQTTNQELCQYGLDFSIANRRQFCQNTKQN